MFKSSKFELKPVQVEGVEFLLNNVNSILGFQTGLGKTLTSLVAARTILDSVSYSVCFIICPVSAVGSFEKELRDKIEEKYSVVTSDRRLVDYSYRFVIGTYTNLQGFGELLKAYIRFGKKPFLIADEVHIMQSSGSNQSMVLRKMRPYFKCVFGLTATPLLNALDGLYRVVDFIRPGYFGAYNKFCYDFITYTKQWVKIKGKRKEIKKPSGFKNMDFLKQLLDGVLMVKRIKYDLRFHYLKTSFLDGEHKLYEEASRGILNTESEKDFSARLYDLQRVVDGVTETSPDSSKQQLLIDTVKGIILRGEGVIVYTEYEDTYSYLDKLFKKYKGSIGYNKLYFITGKVSRQERVKIERSLSAGDILVVTRAGCQSLNLQAVNNIIFYNIPFAVANFIQAVGRITRMDSKYDCQNVYILEVDDTIDTYKRILIESRAEVIKDLFGDEKALPDVSDIDTDMFNKYRSYFKKKLLWR